MIVKKVKYEDDARLDEMEARSAYDYYKEENKLKIDKTKTIEENLQKMESKLEKMESKLEKIDEILGKIRKYLKSNKDSKQQL